MARCPVCTVELLTTYPSDPLRFNCRRCGLFTMDSDAIEDLPSSLSNKDNAAAILSHVLYRMTKRNKGAMLTNDLIDKILKSTAIPRPQEQLENLILWVGETQTTVGALIKVPDSAIAAVGTSDTTSLTYLLQQGVEKGLISGDIRRPLDRNVVSASVQLTIGGWSLYEDLLRGKASSRIAFMAMKFGDEEGDTIFRDHFKPAVKATGFELKRLDEGQPAGLIDDRLRVEIRQSRFLIADLTHHSNGAYWEAGFAEGLGKPVIYTCRKDQFDKGTHFDTNHHLTVVWEAGREDEVVKKLKDTIRATLPGEAKLMD